MAGGAHGDGSGFQAGRVAHLPAVSTRETLDDPGGIVDLWCFRYDDAREPALLAAYAALMTPDEEARHRRYVFAKDQLQFLATRALVRTVLSEYAPVPAADWRFVEEAGGRPRVLSPEVAPPLFFNLSNTAGMVVCAVSAAHRELGVDVEFLGRPGETVSVAGAYFSPFEARALHELPLAAQRQRFFWYWTLKESYIKAKGLGLAIPLERFSFLLDEGPAIGVRFDRSLGDDPGEWRFSAVHAERNHLVAVGVKTDGAPLRLRAVEYVPLRGIVPFPARAL